MVFYAINGFSEGDGMLCAGRRKGVGTGVDKALLSRRRMVPIEVLRFVAIVGIAVFHTVLPMYDAMTGLSPHVAAEALQSKATLSVEAVFAAFRPSAWLLGMSSLLGAYGNHVFFMISGFFLIPRCASDSRRPGFVGRQLRLSGKRLAKVLFTLAFYAALMMAVNRWLYPIPDVGNLWWVTYNIEFIWLYMAFVACAPLVGWLIERCRGRRWPVAVFAVALLALYVFNGYVAVVVRGSFPSLSAADWRKQMAGVTYFASFALAGAVGCAWRTNHTVAGKASAATGRTVDSEGGVEPNDLNGTAGTSAVWWTKRFWVWFLVVSECVVSLLVGIVVASGDYDMLKSLSFKSTSVISFALAFGSLMCAVCAKPAEAPRGPVTRVVRQMVVALSSGILGFYLVQGLGYNLVAGVVARATAGSSSRVVAAALAGHLWGCVGWQASWWLVSWFVSLTNVVLVCAFDRLVRQPLFRALHLI
jgi:hypothetical protein